jgi:rfaE bifunctional protein kinase chain/domain/rfaE bifunctional protein nucleotidyltransferase chain/domain
MSIKENFFYKHKIKTVDELKSIIGEMPRQKKVIMCHGTFDIVHPGHVRHLLYAQSRADIVVVSITEDKHVSKAAFRPYVPEELRSINLAAFEMVDYVIIDRNPTPINTLKQLKPDFFCKGYDYFTTEINPKTQEEIDVVDSYGGEVIFSPGDIVYSSSELIEMHPPGIAVEKLMLLMAAEKLQFADLRQALEKFKGLKVHVVGDTIVDSLTHCVMIGGMAKTPTMSVRYQNREDYVGGAAIVAKHLSAAGAEVTFSTVLGNDPLQKLVLDDLAASGVKCLALIDEKTPTTHKNAIVVNNYRLLKIDTVDNRTISHKFLKRLIEQIQTVSGDAIVFSDFRHGIFDRKTVPALTKAIPTGMFKVADSQLASRWGNILDFTGFDLITPNEKEARFALGDQDSVIRPLASELFKQANCKLLMLKMGERGMMVIREEVKDDPRSFFILDSFAEKVVDPVGAGDALLAYATLGLLATKSGEIAAILGGIAAAIECEKEGNIPVSPQNILDRIERMEKWSQYEVTSKR